MPTKPKQLIPSQEFRVGKYDIGWIDSDFLPRLGHLPLTEKPAPIFHTITEYITEEEIEKKFGLCELGDLRAFLLNPPEGSKDGYVNLFLIDYFVVRVYWYSGGRSWGVGAWRRHGSGWVAGGRVFSPETGSQKLGTVSSEPLPSELETAISLVKKAGYKIMKEV